MRQRRWRQTAGLCVVCALVAIDARARGQEAQNALPDAPSAALMQMPGAQPEQPQPRSMTGAVTGSVTDRSGAVLAGAQVTLVSTGRPGGSLTTVTDSDGTFRFAAVPPGPCQITVAHPGFAGQSVAAAVSPGETATLAPTRMMVAAAPEEVAVVASVEEIAEAQVKAQERQRVLGIIPNFGVTYDWHAAPLTTRQKFALAWRSEIDPVSFLGAAVGAGYEQGKNYRKGYGQGAQGFAKRFGASYVDGFNGAMIGSAILPSLLHQDPRYFYMGKEHGTLRHRALYAISTVVITRGDNGRWQPNYSSVLGALASGAISNAYYPPDDRGVALTIDNALLGTASGAIGSLVQEFLIKHISTGVPKP